MPDHSSSRGGSSAGRYEDGDSRPSRSRRRKTNPALLLCEAAGGGGDKGGVAGRRLREAGWDEKIREAMDAVRERLGVRPLSGRLVRQYSPLDREEAAFEISTDGGPLIAVRRRDGSIILHLQNRTV
ncbi:MAG: hypothetical protein N3A38_15315 [Planctomycetota bacterium]|nr:hypothetical protein [Planctomycetota bacterium]